MSEYIIDYELIPLKWRDGYGLSDIDLKEEIVRCRDCKHGHESDWPVFLEIPSDYLDCTGPLVATWDEYHDVPKDNPVEPDGFCKWGERRENE